MISQTHLSQWVLVLNVALVTLITRPFYRATLGGWRVPSAMPLMATLIMQTATLRTTPIVHFLILIPFSPQTAAEGEGGKNMFSIQYDLPHVTDWNGILRSMEVKIEIDAHRRYVVRSNLTFNGALLTKTWTSDL